MNFYDSEVEIFKEKLSGLSKNWDGRECVLELKDADYNWRQMEWFGWYFEFKARSLLQDVADIPGDRYGNVTFDLKKQINWDLKASAQQKVILNDKDAMDLSIAETGYHGEIISLYDVEYDIDRSFQNWHTELKGGKSNYEKKRESRTAKSRSRKVKATLKQIMFVILKNGDLESLSIMRQGRNSDDSGSLRKIKYMLDLNKIHLYEHHQLIF